MWSRIHEMCVCTSCSSFLMRVHLAHAPGLHVSGVRQKPKGVWYAFDHAWCNYADETGMPAYTHAFQLTMHRRSLFRPTLPSRSRQRHPNRLLVLDSKAAVMWFQNMYGWPGPGRFAFIDGSMPSPQSTCGPATTCVPNGLIDWHAVRQDFAGIELRYYTAWVRDPPVPPRFAAQRRYPLNWAYTWDVASGCIWNVAEVIRQVKDVSHTFFGHKGCRRALGRW